jgi:hypothetical protein
MAEQSFIEAAGKIDQRNGGSIFEDDFEEELASESSKDIVFGKKTVRV